MTFQKLKSIVKSKLPCPNLRPPASTPALFHDNSLDKESVTPSHIRSHRTGEARTSGGLLQLLCGVQTETKEIFHLFW